MQQCATLSRITHLHRTLSILLPTITYYYHSINSAFLHTLAAESDVDMLISFLIVLCKMEEEKCSYQLSSTKLMLIPLVQQTHKY